MPVGTLLLMSNANDYNDDAAAAVGDVGSTTAADTDGVMMVMTVIILIRGYRFKSQLRRW